MEHPSSGKGVEGTVRRNPSTGSVIINGRVTGLGPQPQTIYWIAAAPVTRGIGFAGAGAPYPNREIAFENTPHQGKVDSADGSFSIELKDIPAGYYSGLGSIYVPPMVEFVGSASTPPLSVMLLLPKATFDGIRRLAAVELKAAEPR
jgi:hypothetical protein